MTSLKATEIFLVRHGQTEWNKTGRFQGQSDVPLSEVGREQAILAAKYFPAERLDKVYASDLSRAADTGRAIADRLGAPIELTKKLREMYFGQWEGLSYDEIVRGWPDAGPAFFDAPDTLIPPDGETFQMVQDRATPFLEEIVRVHTGESIAIVAHGAIIRTIVAYVLGMPMRYVWRTRQGNTGISRITYSEGVYTVDYLNRLAHLEQA
ncbi:alpha-ribazole phosphatase [Selenomonas sp. TAMA-11512]|uniref:alpha-ribazole phosphatase n=1 Tax=Selenomonas sp. TAMA-11512 TaxID=3095337 RepID=UPI00308CEF18|nr:alpha-ribazole phosphatase [Selenomonas sp. TAMA-11512]